MRHTVTILGLLAPTLTACVFEDLDQDGVPRHEDCNDADPSQGRPEPLHVDGDGDGAGGPTIEIGCIGNVWLVADQSDCNDDDPDVHPGAGEIGCDGRDNDCDPSTVDGPAISGIGRTWPTVQQAIDETTPGGRVTLCASRIVERVTVREPLELRGAGADRTILDAMGEGTAIDLVAGSSVVGLTVTGGRGTHGGGIHVTPGPAGPATLRDVAVRDNHADEGGGIWAAGTSLVLQDVVIADNHATRGGGLLLRNEDPHDLVLQSVTIEDNRAEEGGGAWLHTSGQAEVVSVRRNRATRGGGLWLEGVLSSATATFELAENSADEGGGAATTGTLGGATLQLNTANQGGGLITTGPTTLLQVALRENQALNGDGGGLYARHPATLQQSTVESNEAEGEGGGVRSEASLTLRDTAVVENRARLGGGLALYDTARVEDTRFVDNVAHDRGGAVYSACIGGRIVLIGGVLESNRAPVGAATWIGGGEVQLVGSQLLRNEAGETSSGAVEIARATCDTSSVVVGDDMTWSGNAPYDLGVAGQGFDAPGQPFICEVEADAAGCRADP